MNLTDILNSLIGIFVIVDPFAVIPIYLSLTENYSEADRRHTRHKASFVGLGILLVFAVSGTTIFNIFGITLPAFQIAGGILLLLLGIAQLNATRDRVKPEEETESHHRDDISVFPLGTPLIAGPGAISTVILYASKCKNWIELTGLLIAVCGAVGASHLVLKGAPYLFRILGRTGLNLLTRIMGVILTALAIQFILNGLTTTITNLGLIK